MQDSLVKRAVQWTLQWVRRLMTNRYGKMAVLLLGHCFIRPSDFTPARPGQIHFRRFGLLVPAAPASFYAAANVALIRNFALHDMATQLGSAQEVSMLQQYFRQEKFIYAFAFALILISCYFSACIMFGFHRTMCFIFGKDKTNRNNASFKFFLVKSSIVFAWLTAFSWLLVFLVLSDPQKSIPFVADFVNRRILYIIPCIAILYFLVKICRTNGRMAMREIYLDGATYQHVQSITILTLVTTLAILTFLS